MRLPTLPLSFPGEIRFKNFLTDRLFTLGGLTCERKGALPPSLEFRVAPAPLVVLETNITSQLIILCLAMPPT
jgi:hypothetical protein